MKKILKIALKKFKELKEAYDGAKNDGLNGINPAMLIQVKNSDKNDKENQTIENLVKKYKKIVEKMVLNELLILVMIKIHQVNLEKKQLLKNYQLIIQFTMLYFSK